MTALICGSLAFDTIMVYPGHFKNEILPDKVHMLNVAFTVPEMRKEFGGCAGNIAYNLALLGGDGAPMGTVGRDFDDYAAWLDQCATPRDYVKIIEDAYTAQAYITTDLDDNQITAFHPGAMNQSHQQAVPENGIKLGTVSPDGREGMLVHAQQYRERDIPFLFDPGQGLPLFDGAELRRMTEQATWVAVNDYESELLCQRTGWSRAEIVDRVEALIVTRGPAGSSIFQKGRQQLDIPAANPSALADPTGCGDAYRGGLLFGLLHDLDWETVGRLASLMGAIKIERPGTQNHCFNRSEFAARFRDEFGYSFE